MSDYARDDDYIELGKRYDELYVDKVALSRKMDIINWYLEYISKHYKVDSRHPGYHLIPTETFMKLVQLGMADD
jgi:hypothetical protein